MIVGYCRISRDEDKGTNTSIPEQISLIEAYANRNNIILDKILVDDNFSGYVTTKYDDTLFDRPGFIQMYELAKQRHIDTIIAKDLSRIGRQQDVVVLTLKRFRSWGCSCIDINGKPLLDNTTGVISWSHEFLVEETSRKVRDTFANKQKNGTLLMSNFYFGYIKKNKTELYIDDEIALLIRLIFTMYMNGSGYTKIAMYLNEQTDYPTPSRYFALKKQEAGESYNITIADRWEAYHVARILGDELYCGTLTTHKKESLVIKGSAKRVPKDRQYRFPNHHEAIIPQEDFEFVQELRHKRDDGKYRAKAYPYIFSGFCVCGECGKRAGGLMLARSTNKPAYNCCEYTRYGRKACTNKCISEADLLLGLQHYLLAVRNQYADIFQTQPAQKSHHIEKELPKYKKQLTKYEAEYRSLQKRKNLELSSKGEEYNDIILTQYAILENECLENIKIMKARISEQENQPEADVEKKEQTYFDRMGEVIGSNRPNRKALELLIDRIVLNVNRSITIYLNVEETHLGGLDTPSD